MSASHFAQKLRLSFPLDLPYMMYRRVSSIDTRRMNVLPLWQASLLVTHSNCRGPYAETDALMQIKHVH